MCQLLRAKSVATKESLLQSILEKNIHMQSTCGKCVHVLLCTTYVASISQMHTVVLLQGKCKSINVYRRAIYRRARRGGKLIKKLPFLGHLSPKVYTHYVCFPSLLFLGVFMTLWTFFGNLWQPAIRERLCTQEGQERGEAPPQKSFFAFLGHLSP